MRLGLSAALLLLGGCAVLATELSVLRQFEAQFQCRDLEPSYTPGGWRVEGCGTEAFYHCAENAGCWLVLQRPLSAERLQARADRFQRIIASIDGEPPAARAKFRGGVLLAHAPPDEPDFAVLTLIGDQPLKLSADCPVRLQHDSTPLTIVARRQADPRRAQLLTFSEDLNALVWSKRFGGDVCGVPVELDKRARKQLARFDL